VEKLDSIYENLKVVSHSILFEVKLQKKKFFIFSIIAIIFFFLNSLVPYVFMSGLTLPYSQIDLYQRGIVFFMTFLFLTTGFFFSGIICTEYKKKTGLTLLPLIDKHNLIIGKYIANYILVIGIAVIQYFLMALLNFYFYAEPIPPSLFLSFGYLALYVLALASVITFLSSFMPSSSPVIIIIIALLLFGFSIIDVFVKPTGIEPLYSLTYLYNIISNIIYPEFSTMERYSEYTQDNITHRIWSFPSAEGALIVLTLYAIVFFLLGYLLFKRRQL
jgi:ABC-type transport system involved in multi-copper enzyme maturation permease subunit